MAETAHDEGTDIIKMPWSSPLCRPARLCRLRWHQHVGGGQVMWLYMARMGTIASIAAEDDMIEHASGTTYSPPS
jgi:hypothetical protein